MKELSSLRLRVVVLVYGLIVHNVQRAARLFSMRQSVGNLEPRVAVRHGSMLNLGHWATTELSSTVLSHILALDKSRSPHCQEVSRTSHHKHHKHAGFAW